MKENMGLLWRISSFFKALIMFKCVLLLIFISTLQTFSMGYGQTKISVDLQQVTLKNALKELELKTDYRFLYNDDIFPNNSSTITLKAKDASMEEIMSDMLAGINLTYKVSGKNLLVILPKTDKQAFVVNGKVIDEKGEAMIGVSVIEKGTTNGISTDVNGNYQLTVTDANAVLVFKYIGYLINEVKVSNQQRVNVTMAPDMKALEEVVVVGFATQKQATLTGAVSQINGSEVLQSPSANVALSLAGRVTGLASVQYSGKPGADDPSIYVRGIGSLTESGSTPLMLVDGVERSFTQLDATTIETVSILKDAAATAVYGIRGANGVIIVTTKRGFEGTPKISFNSSYGLQVPTKLVDMVDSYEYAIKHNQATLNDNPNAVVKFSPQAVEAFRTGSDPLIYPNTDWADYIVKSSAAQSQNSINIRGGSKVVKYFVALGNLHQDGLFNTFSSDDSYNYKYDRYTYRANIDLDMTPSTKFSLTIGGRSDMRQEPAGQPSEGVFRVLYWSVPYSGTLVDGKRILIGNEYIPGEKKDGLTAVGWGAGSSRASSNVMNLDLGVTQKLNFIPGLSWRAKLSNNTTAGQGKTRSSSKATYAAYYKKDVDPTAAGDNSIVFRRNGTDGLLGYSESSSKARDWYLETALAYDKDFGPHQVTGLLLYNETKRYYPGSFGDIPQGYVGIAARTTYNYKSKYMLDLNLGYNGSENFAPGKRFGFFPAVSGAWNITEEPFLKDKISFLDYLKFRVSYGVVGNDRQGSSRFLYMADSYTASSGGYSFGTATTALEIAAAEGRIGNPDVTWERAKKQNYGIDLKALKGKLNVTADYFYEYRNSILTTRNTVPSILSVSLPAMNIGEVRNQGYELAVKWNHQIGQVGYWLSPSMSFARNKILYMDEVPKNEDYLLQTGRRVNERFGYVFDAFWSEADVARVSDFPDHLYSPKAGDARYKDLNGDMIINADDQMSIAFPDYPEYTGSLSGGFDFKGFTLNMLWTGATNVSRELNDTWRVAFSELGDRALLKWLSDNSWTPENAATAKAPRMTFSGRINNTKTSTLWLRDASYIRLKNLELGYTFKGGILKRVGVSNLRLTASGYDLVTFDKLKFVDPEARTSTADYPLVKIYNIGVNVNF